MQSPKVTYQLTNTSSYKEIMNSNPNDTKLFERERFIEILQMIKVLQESQVLQNSSAVNQGSLSKSETTKKSRRGDYKQVETLILSFQ